MISLVTSQDAVNRVLATFLSEQKQAALAIHPSYSRLYEEIERVVLAGGKRLRPHLVFAGYGAYNDSIAYVAAAHELLHAALLVHDDIIDRDNLRHGQATIHHSYESTHYQEVIANDTDRYHFSQSAAILAGDLLISSAYQLIAKANLSDESYKKAVELISTAIFEVAGGELLDTEAPFQSDCYEPMIIYRYKTAGYSFIAPLLTGAVLSHCATPDDIEYLREYATNLGIAYQIKDDLLGVFGDTDATGKSTYGDLREGKYTLLISEFKDRATDEQLRLFTAVFGHADADEHEFKNLKDAIEASGATEATRELEIRFTEKARRAAHSIGSETLKEELLFLIGLLQERQA